MNKYSTIGLLESSLNVNMMNRYKVRQSTGALHLVQMRTQVMDENLSYGEKLDIIRRKYTSKERNSFRKEEGEVKREGLRERVNERVNEKVNQRARSQLNLTEYYGNTYGGQFIKKENKKVFGEEIKDRHERSKEKVCERVENIRKINDKIKNILNRFEIGEGKNSIGKRENLVNKENQKERREKEMVASSLKTKKLQLLEQQIKSRELTSKSTLQTHFTSKPQPNLYLLSQPPKPSLQPQPFTNYPFNYTTTVHVSHNQSLIDQSFVLQKYNPSNLPISPLLSLISKLCNQIQHDQQLRTAKYFFLLSLHQDKYQKLQLEFQRRGLQYSLEELTEMMRFAEEEYDPFMYEIAHEDYGRYVESWMRADEYWRENLKGKFVREELEKEGMEERLLGDGGEKIDVSSFVRFVNMASGNMYKNRDVVVIMRRIGEGRVTVEQVYRAFCGEEQ